MFLCIDSFIDSFIAGKSFIFMFICSFMFLCIDSFTDSFIAGKTMKSLSDRRTMDLVTLEEKLKNLAAQPNSQLNVEPTYLFGICHPGSFENADVSFPLQLHQENVSRLDTAIYQYRFPHVSNSNG